MASKQQIYRLGQRWVAHPPSSSYLLVVNGPAPRVRTGVSEASSVSGEARLVLAHQCASTLGVHFVEDAMAKRAQ